MYQGIRMSGGIEGAGERWLEATHVSTRVILMEALVLVALVVFGLMVLRPT